MTPRLRDDLVAATVEEDGVLYVDLTDPTTGVSFRFYDFEYELAKQLNGQPVEAVVAWASLTYQTEMTTAALDEFVDKLAGLGFLAMPGVVARAAEPPPSSPFTLSAKEVAETESIGVASAPMFEGLTGELFGDVPAGSGAPAIAAPGLTPAVSAEAAFGRLVGPFGPAEPAPPSSRRAVEAGAPEPSQRERSGGAPTSRPRTLTGVTLAPLTPMTAPGGADTTASPPALPRLQSLGSPLPPLMADAVRGGAEVKRSPPRPGSNAQSPVPVAVPAPKPQSSPWPVIPASTSPPVAKSSAAAKSSARAPVAASPSASDETPFASIAHAIVSEAEFPRGWPSLGEGLEHSGPTPAMGSIIPPEALAGGPERDDRAHDREKRRQSPAPAAAAKVAPSPVAPATSGPAATVAPSPSAVPPATLPSAVPPATSAPVAPAPPLTPSAAPLPAVAAAAAVASATTSTSGSASSPGASPAVATESAPPAALSVSTAAAEAPAAAPAPVGGPSSAVGAAGPSRMSAAWVAALTDEVERPAAVERRQPPPPEVVVMPPVEPSAMPPVPKRRAPLVAGVVVLGAVVAGAVVANRQPASHLPVPSLATPSVHVTTPQPTTTYEWFRTPGKVIPGRDDEVGFKVAGRLQDVMPPGTTFSAGEAVAHLQGSATRELNVNRIRSRVAFFEQLRDSSRAAGNEAAARPAEANVVARKRELADAQARLSEMEIRPAMAGTIGEVLIQRGAPVRAGAPVFRIRAAGPRATFPFSAEEQAKARALGFCRVETVPGEAAGAAAAPGAGTAAGTAAGAPAGAAAPSASSASASGGGEAPSPGAGGALAPGEKPARIVDCALPATVVTGPAASPPSASPLAVDLPAAAGVTPGTAVRLASARFDGVFPIPRKAVVRGAAGGDRVWVVSEATQAADSRAVELAPSNGEPALVTRGLAAGDMVIVDPPADLASGVQVNVLR